MEQYLLSEIRSGEKFLGNSGKRIRPEFKHIKSLRLGGRALDINGHPLSPDYVLPLFVNEGPDYDEYNRVMLRLSERARVGY